MHIKYYQIKLNKLISTHIFHLLIVSSLLIFFFNCATTQLKNDKASIIFAVLSNTFPDSPFNGFPDILEKAVEDINGENPHLVIHAGNIIHGGEEWMGIKPIDMDRQFRKFNHTVSGLNSLLFTAIGERDQYNGATDFYRKYTGRPDYYSFNYGNLHFLVLKTSLKVPGLIDYDQAAWLKKDLEKYKGAAAVIIVTHHSLYVPEKGGKAQPGAGNLHKLFAGYPVRLCVSAAEGDFSRVREGNIEYISAGCGGYNEESRLKNDRHFYIIDFDGTAVKVTEKISFKQ